MSSANYFTKRINKIIKDNNYMEVVRKDWEQSDSGYIRGLQTIYRVREDKEHIKDKYIKCTGKPNKALISEILAAYPESIIDDVCNVIKQVDLDKLLSNSSYAGVKMENAINSIKLLNDFRKNFGSTIDQYEHSEDFPFIVNELLKEAYALATAYRNFLTEAVKKSRYNSDCKEYESLTRHAEWKPIIENIFDILFKHKAVLKKSTKTKPLPGELAEITHLTTKLLAAEYPLCWGEDQVPHAEKIIKERLYRYTINKNI